jgi:hypothetical protein
VLEFKDLPRTGPAAPRFAFRETDWFPEPDLLNKGSHCRISHRTAPCLLPFADRTKCHWRGWNATCRNHRTPNMTPVMPGAKDCSRLLKRNGERPSIPVHPDPRWGSRRFKQTFRECSCKFLDVLGYSGGPGLNTLAPTGAEDLGIRSLTTGTWCAGLSGHLRHGGHACCAA